MKIKSLFHKALQKKQILPLRKIQPLMEQSIQVIADHVQAQVRRRLPTGVPGLGAYRKGLRVLKVAASGRRVVLAVLWEPRLRPKIQAKGVELIQVRKKVNVTKPSPITDILAKYSPWHPAVFPVKPPRREAVLLYEKVSVAESKKVLTQNKRQRQQWKKEFKVQGITLQSRRAQQELLSFSGEGEKLGFTAQDAWRLEFGYRARRALPIWRPVLRGVVRRGFFGIIKTSRDKLNPANSLLKGKLRKLSKLGTLPENDLRIDKFSRAVAKGLK